MNYSVTNVQQNGMDLVLLKNTKTGTEVAVLPEVGGLLHAFTIHHGQQSFNIIDNYNDLAQAKREISHSFKSAKLSPFACRIPEGKYVFGGRESEFGKKFIDGSAIHGLLYDKPFSITQQLANEQTASVSLRYAYKHEDDAYPYDYKCFIKYSLYPDDLLQVQTIISNEGPETMPVADGWHPYFRLGGQVDDWEMYFDAESIVEFDEKLIPTGRMLPYHHFNEPKKIGDVFLDNCFVLKTISSRPACELLNPANRLRISFFPGNTYPYLQVFTPPHRKSIAIENLSSAPDSFNNKMGLMVLRPTHSQTFTVGYQVSWT